MRLAVLDIGTNTVLLLIASIDDAGAITPEHQEQHVIRVGEGIHSSQSISGQAASRLIASVRQLSETARIHHGLSTLHAVGTSVFRRAENAMDILDQLRSETGVSIETLSGEEEARLTFDGAVGGTRGDAAICVVDIGGGSTEFVVGQSGNTLLARSIDMGVVVAREEYFDSFPISPDPRRALEQVIRERLFETCAAVRACAPTRLIAVAGTPTTLAALHLGLESYDGSRVDGTIMDVRAIADLVDMLVTRSLDQLRALPCVDARRADVLPAGGMILHACMRMIGFDAVEVSDRGVRFGVAAREWRRAVRV